MVHAVLARHNNVGREAAHETSDVTADNQFLTVIGFSCGSVVKAGRGYSFMLVIMTPQVARNWPLLLLLAGCSMLQLRTAASQAVAVAEAAASTAADPAPTSSVAPSTASSAAARSTFSLWDQCGGESKCEAYTCVDDPW